ncbi:MAG TPA: aldehyde ferredoxin oxidoreductase family protein [Anaerolineaceae bacterium]|nr:aldehyde ferredoxin oxidoreductase family protein [Anaerolineaceae bacterium]
MIPGVLGKILWVDLTQKTCTPETVRDEIYERYLSGLGLAAAILSERIPAGADPLGPENVLALVAGLLTATGTLFTGRWMAAAKSPLTGTWGDANCGGSFSAAIKHSGFDGIFFSGASDRPVYLLVDHGRAELRDASSLWGMDALETEKSLMSSVPGRRLSVACIGPAGEKLSRISGISHDGGRMAARSGLGAVMGAKRLKAVALAGNQTVTVKDRAEIRRLNRELMRWVRLRIPLPSGRLSRYLGSLMRALPVQFAQDGLLYKAMLQKWGTISMNQIAIEMGDGPVRNWRGSNLDFGLRRSSAIDPDHFARLELRKYHCFACPLGCGGICQVGGDGLAKEMHRPEYETVLALSSLLLNEDLDTIFELNDMLNRAGMDSISAGGTLAFALECYERGILTRAQTGGLDLTWGNAAAIKALLGQMIAREGLGDLLADGVRAAAERLGNGAAAYAVNAGGQELAMHDGRADPGFSLHAMLEPTPGRHTLGSQLYYEMFQLWTRVPGLPKVRRLYWKGRKYQAGPEKAVMAAACSKFMQVINGAGGCLFGALIGVNRLPVFQWLNAVTGWRRTPEEYMEIGAAIQTLRQGFNAREGAPLRHPIHPRALGQPPLAEGANRGRCLDLEPLVRQYWQQFGWDPETGKPVYQLDPQRPSPPKT